MGKFRPLAEWALLARKKQKHISAHGARWLCGSDHSVLGQYSLEQCLRADHLAELICKK